MVKVFNFNDFLGNVATEERSFALSGCGYVVRCVELRLLQLVFVCEVAPVRYVVDRQLRGVRFRIGKLQVMIIIIL